MASTLTVAGSNRKDIVSNFSSQSPRTKFIVGSGDVNPSLRLTVASRRKYGYILVSRLYPDISTSKLKEKMFLGIEDITVSQLITKHPTYASFNIRLPIEKLDDGLELKCAQ